MHHVQGCWFCLGAVLICMVGLLLTIANLDRKCGCQERLFLSCRRLIEVLLPMRELNLWAPCAPNAQRKLHTIATSESTSGATLQYYISVCLNSQLFQCFRVVADLVNSTVSGPRKFRSGSDPFGEVLCWRYTLASVSTSQIHCRYPNAE